MSEVKDHKVIRTFTELSVSAKARMFCGHCSKTANDLLSAVFHTPSLWTLCEWMHKQHNTETEFLSPECVQADWFKFVDVAFNSRTKSWLSWF